LSPAAFQQGGIIVHHHLDRSLTVAALAPVSWHPSALGADPAAFTVMHSGDFFGNVVIRW
jgi:hypothetical protein